MKAILIKYMWNVLLAFDQFINAILGGDPDETISSRLGKHLEKRNCKFCNFICKLLNIIDPNHCRDAIERDEGKDAIIP